MIRTRAQILQHKAELVKTATTVFAGAGLLAIGALYAHYNDVPTLTGRDVQEISFKAKTDTDNQRKIHVTELIPEVKRGKKGAVSIAVNTPAVVPLPPTQTETEIMKATVDRETTTRIEGMAQKNKDIWDSIKWIAIGIWAGLSTLFTLTKYTYEMRSDRSFRKDEKCMKDLGELIQRTSPSFSEQLPMSKSLHSKEAQELVVLFGQNPRKITEIAQEFPSQVMIKILQQLACSGDPIVQQQALTTLGIHGTIRYDTEGKTAIESIARLSNSAPGLSIIPALIKLKDLFSDAAVTEKLADNSALIRNLRSASVIFTAHANAFNVQLDEPSHAILMKQLGTIIDRLGSNDAADFISDMRQALERAV